MPNQSVLSGNLARAISFLLTDLGTPKSLSAAIMLREGDWDGLAQLSVDPRCYVDSCSYLRDAAAVSVVKKLQQLPTSVDRRARAIAKWWEGERDCFRSNERLSRYLDLKGFPAFSDVEPGVRDFLSRVRKIIFSWIGPSPNLLTKGRHGPGATYSDKGRLTTVADKMSSVPSMTRDAVWWFPQWINTQWGAAVAQHHGKVSFVPGNRFATVPKTALIDRCIAAEPSINVFYQLGLGRELRSRLKSAGWDLDRAQDIHRQVACESSWTREFATLDLSNASDTVCINLVRLLLPRLWFQALDDLRSKKTLLDDKWIMLEKFSSMGNGFTFELETIIFAALACAVSQQCGGVGRLGIDVFVFGDDIIIKNDYVRSLIPVLQFCGFRLNAEKSFFDQSPFRESCGGDFFSGLPVRPIYLKELPNEPQEFVTFANQLWALAERLRENGFSLPARAWFAVLDELPAQVRRCRGPKDLGDLLIWDHEDRWTTRTRRSIRYFRVIRPFSNRYVGWGHFQPEVTLACATYGSGDGKRGVLPRDSISGYKLGWTPFS
jgi:hypothetical protein